MFRFFRRHVLVYFAFLLLRLEARKIFLLIVEFVSYILIVSEYILCL